MSSEGGLAGEEQEALLEMAEDDLLVGSGPVFLRAVSLGSRIDFD